ncbi:F-box/kelch-repeat protein At3g24760 [Rhododendron vialii]|uniref:F-box/kelch-repeat protein At3g24760 n=1 Tax=Rhododendron vialii TaxID=182163 RepID=UPI00265DCA08|nr:F-box/kelch-repeat protein At3g24760 [Rhododendron vialii]XP_058207191.1 F-box/kelch-repeat protein At3g24760 [Rhododendron vialii]
MEESKSIKEPDPFSFDYIGSDLTELILSHLPIRSIVRAAAVCKPWRSIITSAAFSRRVSAAKKPWLFLYGQNNIFLKNNQAFAFDPESNEWIKLPTALFPLPTSQEESFVGSGGFFFTTAAAKFSYAPILKDGAWRQTPPLKFSRCNPLVGVYDDRAGFSKFIVVGGVRFIGGLVDIEDRLAVEIYNPFSNSWDLCPPLPADFRSGNSSQWLSSALFKGKFYVFGICSCFVSSFDLSKRFWSEVQTLRPPGVLFSFLISCQDQLVLAGLSNAPRGPSFNLWKVDEETMEFSEIAIMPQELLYGLFDSDEDDKLASLKCVGLGNLIYVFNEEHHRNYPACVCEISSDSGKCSWRRVPNLMVPANRFHKVISFCSTISLGNILQGEGEELGLGQAVH